MTKLINVLLLAFGIYVPAIAAPTDQHLPVQPDTLNIQRRTFDKKILEEFKSDADFQYGRPRAGLTLWQRILIEIATLFSWLMYWSTHTVLGQIIFYGLCAMLILYVVLKVLNIEVRDIFYRTSSAKMNFQLAEENIHELDFEKLIHEAASRKEYRNAVRLVFLFSLKKLSDANLIQWTPGKTNDEYPSQLKQHPAKQRLQELRYYFDYAWYGHFEITGQTFDHVNQTFQEFNSTLA